MQNPRVDGSSQQVIGSGDGMDVPSQVKVELQMKRKHLPTCFKQPHSIQALSGSIKCYVSCIALWWAGPLKQSQPENQGQGILLDNRELLPGILLQTFFLAQVKGE